MGGLGGQNPLPFQLGGGASLSERIYTVLRRAAGERAGGSPIEPQGGIADAWRWAKAKAIAAVLSGDERAFSQAFPGLATDRLELFEAILGLAQAPTDAERAAACLAAWTASIAADIPSLTADLQKIDPHVTVDPVDYAQGTTTNLGKMFGGLPGAGQPYFGSPTVSHGPSSAAPNYSSDFVCHVRYTMPAGMLTPPVDKLAALKDRLQTVLPSWCGFVIYTSTGFYLDGGADGTSLLDITAFG